jgi:hypothetical protein
MNSKVIDSKIGLLTWANNNNYGTILQMYALSKTIEKLGYCVEIINYVPRKSRRIPFIIRLFKEPQFTVGRIKLKMMERLYKKYKYQIDRKIEKFKLFRQTELTFTEPCSIYTELLDLNKRYTAFICGSDQIWNPSFFDKTYYLNFVQNESKMIAYAPSMGVSNIKNKDVAEKMAKLISRFKYLSIREDIGRDIIYHLAGQKAEVVLDPTLLLDDNDWNNFINNADNSEENYLLCYFLGQNERHWNMVKKIQKIKNMPVKVIPRYSKDCTRKFEIQSCVGPRDFLRLFRDASFVCTDSFHGTIFSILYKKQFLVFKRFSNRDPRSENSRIFSLLRQLSIEDRIISGKNIYNILSKDADFNLIDPCLSMERKRSIDFLSSSIKKTMEV